LQEETIVKGDALVVGIGIALGILLLVVLAGWLFLHAPAPVQRPAVGLQPPLAVTAEIKAPDEAEPAEQEQPGEDPPRQ
jgi:hypothetical protein